MNRLLFILLLIIFIGCKESIKFNKERWAAESEPDYSDRDKMLPDLIKNYKLKGISYKDLTDMLSTPQFIDSLEVTYDIYVNYDVIDPRGGKRLIFYLDKDSIVTDYKVEKWSNRRQKWWMWQ